jgi:hypothetical protein
MRLLRDRRLLVSLILFGVVLLIGLVVRLSERPALAPPALVAAPTATPTASGTPAPTATRVPAPTATRPPTASPTPTPRPTQTPTLTPAPPTPTPLPPTPTLGPVLRETKWGVGIYWGGNHQLEAAVRSGAGVVLLMNPDEGWARKVRQWFPKAFIVGRRALPQDQQPLDNPEQRGRAYADWVAELGVPLRDVVNAWVSYNEVVGHNDYEAYRRYNRFQVAFALRMREHGLKSVAGNDGPGVVEPEDYPEYFGEAIRASDYFGVHAYAPRHATTLRAEAEWHALRYRKIFAALEAAGIRNVKMILTETGLWDGWRGVVSDVQMAADFIWLTRELERDPYVIGQAAFGIFGNGTWRAFDLHDSAIPSLLGNYQPGG